MTTHSRHVRDIENRGEITVFVHSHVPKIQGTVFVVRQQMNRVRDSSL